jgi:hypothetical protein
MLERTGIDDEAGHGHLQGGRIFMLHDHRSSFNQMQVSDRRFLREGILRAKLSMEENVSAEAELWKQRCEKCHGRVKLQDLVTAFLPFTAGMDAGCRLRLYGATRQNARYLI